MPNFSAAAGSQQNRMRAEFGSGRDILWSHWMSMRYQNEHFFWSLPSIRPYGQYGLTFVPGICIWWLVSWPQFHGPQLSLAIALSMNCLVLMIIPILPQYVEHKGPARSPQEEAKA